MPLLWTRQALTEQLVLVLRPRVQEVPGGLKLGIHCSEHTLSAESIVGVHAQRLLSDQGTCPNLSRNLLVDTVCRDNLPMHLLMVSFFSGRRAPNSEQTVHLTAAWS